MKGWIRLWLLLSLIWSAVVIIRAFAEFVPIRPVDEQAIVQSLSGRSASFFRDWTLENKLVSHTQRFRYSDGSDEAIRFPILSEEEMESIPDRVRRNFDGDGKQIDESEMSRFVRLVRDKNGEAIRATQEFERLANDARESEHDRQARFIRNNVFLLFSFPLGSLALALGAVWVIAGFKNRHVKTPIE